MAKHCFRGTAWLVLLNDLLIKYKARSLLYDKIFQLFQQYISSPNFDRFAKFKSRRSLLTSTQKTLNSKALRPSNGTVWCKLPRKVLYKHTFGAPNQGQMLDVWESQTAESALRWQMCYIVPRHNLELTLEVILEHVLRIKTMTWIFNPESRSNSFSLPRN